jgi:hypothetical protein
MYADTRYLFFSSVSIYARFSTAVLPAKADAKIQPFPIPTKYFFSLGSNPCANYLHPSIIKDEKKFATSRPAPRKTPLRTAKNAEITPPGAAICQQSAQVAAAPRVKPQKRQKKGVSALSAGHRRGAAPHGRAARVGLTPTQLPHFHTTSLPFPYYFLTA